MKTPSKETIDEAIALYEQEISDFGKAITYLKTKYNFYYDTKTTSKKNEKKSYKRK